MCAFTLQYPYKKNRFVGSYLFCAVDRDFIEAKDLKTADKLLLSSGKCVTIEKVAVETLETAETTYNFEVADFHTYYVSESNVLVHNKCPTVEYNGEERVLYRGGDTFEATPNQVKMDAKGNVLPKRGLSVNVDPANSNVIKYGGPHKITYMPQELTFIPIGSPGHYEIIPKVAMPFTQYQNLLNQIIVITV